MPGSSARDHDQSPAHARVGRGEQRVGGHVEADVLHGDQGAGAAEGGAQADLQGHLLVGRPLGLARPGRRRTRGSRSRACRGSRFPARTPACSAASATASSPDRSCRSMPASVLALVREAAPPDRMIRDEPAGDAPSSRRGRSRRPRRPPVRNPSKSKRRSVGRQEKTGAVERRLRFKTSDCPFCGLRTWAP